MPLRTHIHRVGRRGFTITELLVTVGVVAFLAGILLSALTLMKGTGEMAQSMNRLRQIAIWSQVYSTDNRETILPSQFDYRDNPYPGKVRKGPVALGDPHEGTWTDILWTVNDELGIGLFDAQVAPNPNEPSYRYDSPDAPLYEKLGTWDGNPLRSAAPNRDEVPTSGVGSTGTGNDPSGCDQGIAKPFGCGAQEAGDPGYFAANDFFNARPDRTPDTPPGGTWYATGQMRAPDRSVYVTDSYAGEVIFEIEQDGPFSLENIHVEVDYRYNDQCLMLFLDGHVSPELPWADIQDLEENRKIRFRNLDKN